MKISGEKKIGLLEVGGSVKSTGYAVKKAALLEVGGSVKNSG